MSALWSISSILIINILAVTPFCYVTGWSRAATWICHTNAERNVWDWGGFKSSSLITHSPCLLHSDGECEYWPCSDHIHINADSWNKVYFIFGQNEMQTMWLWQVTNCSMLLLGCCCFFSIFSKHITKEALQHCKIGSNWKLDWYVNRFS